MAECIYREAAIKAIYESDHFSVRECFGWRAREIEEVLRAVPAAPVPAASARQWISVEDSLPCYDNPVIVANSALRFVCIGWYHAASDRWELLTRAVYAPEITHWMPLPEPPKGENDG